MASSLASCQPTVAAEHSQMTITLEPALILSTAEVLCKQMHVLVQFSVQLDLLRHQC